MSGRRDGVSVGSQRCVRSARVPIGIRRGGRTECDDIPVFSKRLDEFAKDSVDYQWLRVPKAFGNSEISSSSGISNLLRIGSKAFWYLLDLM